MPAPMVIDPSITHLALDPKVSWQIQLSEEVDTSIVADMFFVDLFDTPISTLEELRKQGSYIICYFSAGSFEDWRPDASQFPAEILGKDLKGWHGEKWLDISRLDLLAPIMEARLYLAVQKGCDGVDPDNVDGFINDTGFPLTADNQLAYNTYLSQAAHSRGLSIGLKNDLDQVTELLPHFDWILNEECFTYHECDELLPFIHAGKPVFIIEYDLLPQAFCQQANQMGFNAIHKNLELDAYLTNCYQFDQP